MKKTIITLCLFLIVAFAGIAYADITLTAPMEITPNATKVKITKVTVLDDRVLAQMSYRSADDREVQTLECELTGADYNAVMNNSVTCPTDDTKSFYTMFKKRIQNRCKSKMNIGGTEN